MCFRKSPFGIISGAIDLSNCETYIFAKAVGGGSEKGDFVMNEGEWRYEKSRPGGYCRPVIYHPYSYYDLISPSAKIRSYFTTHSHMLSPSPPI